MAAIPIISFRNLLVCAMLGLAVFAFGQANYQAQVRGVVTDASGAVVPNAVVTISEVGTNLSHSSTTDSSVWHRAARAFPQPVRLFARRSNQEKQELLLH